jgi:hypothetical protein
MMTDGDFFEKANEISITLYGLGLEEMLGGIPREETRAICAEENKAEGSPRAMVQELAEKYGLETRAEFRARNWKTVCDFIPPLVESYPGEWDWNDVRSRWHD